MLGHPCEISHPLCPMLARIQVKLGFNLHNLSQLGRLGEGENRRVKTEQGIDTLEGRHEVGARGKERKESGVQAGGSERERERGGGARRSNRLAKLR